MKRLRSITLVLALALASGCSSTGETGAPGQGGTGGTSAPGPGLCRLHPVQGCTEDCTWNEVLHNDAHCAVCTDPGLLTQEEWPTAVADCGGYHLRYTRGGVFGIGTIRFYDIGTGALVGELSVGQPCPSDVSLWPSGCLNPDWLSKSSLQTYSAWCAPYRADGTGTKCCLTAATWESEFAHGNTNVCSWSEAPAATCGDYNVSLQPRNESPDKYYYDARTGGLVATVIRSHNEYACAAGPAGGFTEPTCPTPPVPVDCPAGSAAASAP